MNVKYNIGTNGEKVNKMGVLLIFLSLLNTVNAETASTFYNKHAEGWFWYQDPKIIEEEKPEAAPKRKEQQPEESAEPKKALTPEQIAQKELAAYRQKIEGAKALALVQPSFQNVYQYLKIQQDMMQRSETFSSEFQRVVLMSPELNPEIKNPTAQFVRGAVHTQQQERKMQVLSNLSKNYGLFFFVSAHCDFCHAFAPVVKMFAEKYGFTVFVIVMNGSTDDPRLDQLKQMFGDLKYNNGIADALQVESTPALIAFNQQTQDVLPVSYAAVSLDKLEDQMLFLQEGNHQ